MYSLEFEMPLPNNYSINALYFKHDLSYYTFNPLPLDEDIDIPNLDVDIDSYRMHSVNKLQSLLVEFNERPD